MRDARRLHILCIDDKPPSFDGFSEFRVTPVRSLAAVEGLLRGGDQPIDIVICDVNMKERNDFDHPKNMNLIWGEDDADPAYGPLLALPFLKASSLCQFVPRSNYWPHVASNGYVLVAMAIIRSLIEKKDVGLADTREWIESRGLSTDITSNVGEGLEGLREIIIKSCLNGKISIAGIASARKAIAAWQPGLPFTEVDGCPVHLEIVYADKIDRIRVASMFSDLADYQTPTSTDHAEAISEALKQWYDKDYGFQFPKYDDIYDCATALLVNALPARDRTFGDLKERARVMSVRTGVDMHCLLRVAIIFAFARGWYFTHVNQSKKFRIEKRANKSAEIGSAGHWGVMHWVHWFLDIDPEQATPQNKFKRLLGTTTTRIEIGDGFYQRPFSSRHADDVLMAYSCLREDETADLLPIEKSLCLNFIKDEERFYPDGMTDQEKVIWNDLKDLRNLPPYPKWLVS